MKKSSFPNESCWNLLKLLEENKKIWYHTHQNWWSSQNGFAVVKMWKFVMWFYLATKNEGSVVNTYQYGMVHEIELSRDELIRKVVIKYRNSSENIDRFTTRAVREFVLKHQLGEIHIMEELENIATTSSIVSYVDWILYLKMNMLFLFVWECKVNRFTVLIKLLVRTI